MNSTLINSTLHSVPEQQSLISTMLMMSIQLFNFFLGVPLNIYIIILLTRAGGLGESVIFPVNQSATEILSALSAPMYALCVVNLCLRVLQKLFSGICLFARMMFQCCVCLERYLAVVHPVTFLKFRPLRYRLACLFMAWAFVLICCINIIFITEREFSYLAGSIYGIVVIVELFCCFSILKVLKQPGPGETGMRRKESNTKTKAFKVVFINLLTHVIQMFPLIITFGLRNTLFIDTWKMTATIALTVNIASGLMPPLVFLYTAGKLTFKANDQNDD